MDRISMKPTHDSIRGYFAAALHDEMEKDDKIYLLVGDLGWKMWDAVRDDYPDRFFNFGASEQLLVGAGVGLALPHTTFRSLPIPLFPQ